MAMPYASLSPAGAADHRSSTATASLVPFCRSTPLSAGGGLGEEDAQASARWPAARPVVPFTPAQYQELEQQALIYKYLVAGVPVPPDLVVPIRRGLDSLATRFYGQPTLGYGPYLGRKLDPEPGRCRRTDGKKWRCSKEAAPDSKYCERHMHRGRNRSRKPVETQLAPQSQPPAAAAVSAAPPLAAAAAATTNGSGFQNHSLYPAIAGSTGGGGGVGGSGNISSPFSSSMGGSSQLHMDSAASYSYAALGGGTAKDLRYNAYGIRSLADEHNQLIAEAIDSSIESQWRLPSSSFPLSSYPHLGALGDLGGQNSTVSSLPKMEKQQPPSSFLGNDTGAGMAMGSASAKQEGQTLRHFFDEWPKARDSWPGLSDETASLASFPPATQLSMSIPMASSDFSVASSQSPNGESHD
uniref:Growth-regulating factor n=1 Tax=Zea mays TaxID=4577 RepID=A0A804PLY6_MAIZE